MKLKPSSLAARIVRERAYYGMLVPGVLLLMIFSYLPMVGLQVAFRDYSIGSSVWAAPWVGLDNFSFASDPSFWDVVKNTLVITILKFLVGFPAPIILALLLHEVRQSWFRKTVQSISYLPNFLSWIVVAYLLDALLSPSEGLVNQLFVTLGQQPQFFLGNADAFVPIVVVSSVWKTVGWSTILYMAALSTIDPQLYEAAVMDGAGRWRQLWAVTLPSLVPIITVLLILNIPSLITAGYEQIYPLMNPANMAVSDVIDTYIIRNGLQQGSFGLASAVGLVSSLVSLILILAANRFSKALGGEGIW